MSPLFTLPSAGLPHPHAPLLEMRMMQNQSGLEACPVNLIPCSACKERRPGPGGLKPIVVELGVEGGQGGSASGSTASIRAEGTESRSPELRGAWGHRRYRWPQGLGVPESRLCHPTRGSEGEVLAFLIPWNLGRPDLASPSQDSRPPARLSCADLTLCSVKDNTGDCKSNCVRLNVFP